MVFLPSQPLHDQLPTASVSRHIDTDPRSPACVNGSTPIPGLAVDAEKTELLADGQDLCYLNIDLVGEDGITKSSEDMPISIEVSGAGTLQAFGSAKPNMGEDFHSRQHTTYYGKAHGLSGKSLLHISNLTDPPLVQTMPHSRFHNTLRHQRRFP